MQMPRLLIPNLPFNSLIALDVSGSRNIESTYLFSLLQKFMGKEFIIFTTNVDATLSFEDLATPENLKNALSKKLICGGTDVQPVVDYFIKNKFDHLVVITDGEFVLPRVDANKVTWVIDEVNSYNQGQDFAYLPGKVIIGV